MTVISKAPKNSDELFKAYAAQSRPSARCGNVSFKGPIFYSYAAPITRLCLHHTSGIKFLLVSEEYANTSSTTSSHIRGVVSNVAVERPDIRILSVYALDTPTETAHIRRMLADMAPALTTMQKARCHLSTRLAALRSVVTALNDIKLLINNFDSFESCCDAATHALVHTYDQALNYHVAPPAAANPTMATLTETIIHLRAVQALEALDQPWTH